MSDLEISKIIVNGRSRKELGDVQALATSIGTVGLLHPIVLTPEYELVAGQRRLEALKLLKRRTAPVHIVEQIDDAVLKLIAERDENTCRKDFTPSEAVAVGQTLKTLEQPKAKDKQRAQGERGKEGGRGRKKNPLPETAKGFPKSTEMNRTSAKVAHAVGMRRDKYERAEAVCKAAAGQPDRFGDLVAEMDSTGNVYGAYRKMKNREAEDTQRVLAAPVKRLHAGVRCGDFRTQLADVPDDSVDLIFTDPPYDKASIPLYGDVARLAARVLKPGGSLICYAGQYALPRIFEATTPHLRYQWSFAVRHSGGRRRMHGWRVSVGWKPLLWFVKGRYEGPYLVDMLDSKPGDKRAHEWAQGCAEAQYLIQQLCPEGGIVLDPMAGSGTTLRVAKALGLRFLGVEIDRDRAKVASAILAGTARQDQA